MIRPLAVAIGHLLFRFSKFCAPRCEIILLFDVFMCLAEGQCPLGPCGLVALNPFIWDVCMGKAAVQRKLKRIKHLARLTKEDPERFEMAWEKRISSWMEQAGKDAGRLETRKGNPVPSPFERVDDALLALSRCGKEIYATHAPEALDLLTSECCKQISRRSDPRLFRMNNYGRLPKGRIETGASEERML